MKGSHSRQDGVQTRPGGHLGLGVLGDSSPAGREPWCSTDLQDVQGLGSTGQMPVLGGEG